MHHLNPRHMPAHLRAPRARVRVQTITALCVDVMQRCIDARAAGHEITSAHAHTGVPVVNTRPTEITHD